MVAITNDFAARSARRPRELVPVTPPPRPCGADHSLGRFAASASPATYRRRRLVAGFAALAVTLAFVMGLAALTTMFDAAPTERTVVSTAAGTEGAEPEGAEAGAGSVPGPVAAGLYVVQPGDTMWSVARSLEPGADPRALVDRLVELNGGAAIEAGQRLRVER